MKLNPVRLLSEMPNKKGELLVPVFIKFGFLNANQQFLEQDILFCPIHKKLRK